MLSRDQSDFRVRLMSYRHQLPGLLSFKWEDVLPYGDCFDKRSHLSNTEISFIKIKWSYLNNGITFVYTYAFNKDGLYIETEPRFHYVHKPKILEFEFCNHWKLTGDSWLTHVTFQGDQIISVAQCRTAVTPVRMHWSYCRLALSHLFVTYNPVASRLHEILWQDTLPVCE